MKNLLQVLSCVGIYLMSTVAHCQTLPDRPNILWISCEDLSPHFYFYGDSTIKTPNLARLAQEGVVYENAFTTAGVCAPSRCAIITGMNQISVGGHNMRTLYSTFPEKTGLPKSYSIVPPPEVRAFPEYLRAKGYYCTNNSKTDYQFEAPVTVWDESSREATWKNRRPGQPFFAVFNSTITHESQVWERKLHPLHVDPARIKVPPIYPDTKTVRQDMARFMSNVIDLDSIVGIILNELEQNNQLENTVIFFWGDHGDGLPNFKREVYDRGLRIPLVVRYPNKQFAGSRVKDLISSIDFGPTVLSIAGIKTPTQMQGRAFAGKYKAETNQYIYGARDRMDSEYDRVRSVRDGRFQYIRNFMAELPHYQNIQFRLQQDMMKEMLELKEKGQLKAAQMKWFATTKSEEEFYDIVNDPFQLNNLINDSAYHQQIMRLRNEMDRWLSKVNDLGAIPEKELLKKMWNGGSTPPFTKDPIILRKRKSITISCETPGASIGYKVYKKNEIEPKRWEVYTKPIKPLKDEIVKAVAQRIGYQPSTIITQEPDN